MDAGSCSRAQLSIPQPKSSSYSKKVNQRYRVPFASGITRVIWVAPLLLLISISSVAQSSKGGISQLIHGSIVRTQAQPVDNAPAEIRDLRGMQMGQSDPEVRIALPPAVEKTAVLKSSRYTVSVARLSIPSKAGKYLESAQRRFTKMDLRGAITEIDRALQIDPDCAPAFSMRAYVKLAANDFSGAVDDAAQATALDSYDPASYIALATAYNYVREFEKAAEAARKALSILPDAWQARLEIAKSLYGQEQYVPALSTLDLVNADFPDVHLVRADVLMCLGRSREGAEQFSLFLRQAPNDPRGEQIRKIVNTARQNPNDANQK